ncbi:putative baseplate assembly protein [Nostocaceae cyanobacterium CENA369]|uniref:Putative baseplate assembly protein n=1 Tax=Dendronalium phyllosphericum CENA369 TaxID=1725256 RepID=A0A8J7HY79_9NOST|nr:putative baseplate assembly protein [Dendronalium phyllosphericum]MBH8572459.1 putative baseplate assembly protein [Dendronalium phyllosphericum CENA369]
MEFDFLPKLPKSNLDDRTFKDLVDECILRIPRYCPEWTNYNPSDPGITLIELFAWLTDQMLLRFNQVPQRNYITFLELLGVRLQAPAPAVADITFYLSAALPDIYTIPTGVEVATLRTETEEAIAFTTDRPLIIDKPRIRHFLSSQTTDTTPQILRDRFTNLWTMRSDGEWYGRELACFDEQPQPGNCFYLVIDGECQCEGNVLALQFKGEAATATGINPDVPPRRWEAWNGLQWESVLLRESDDSTKGFSFSELARQGVNPLQGADVVLHLPQSWPVTTFTAYQGRWLRCVYTAPQPNQPGYSSSPRIIGLAARAIGGTVGASQSELIRNEIVGESDGTPGQTFQLQGVPVLNRREDEYLLISPPGGIPQRWQEVSDFANSGPQDLHYTIDSRTGTVQFGPVIREPAQLQQQTQVRAFAQTGIPLSTLQNPALTNELERQYGAVPPRGSVLRMVAYRTGGGRKGNVQRGTIIVAKTAVPYVARLVNHTPARNGSDAESLEDAVMRVPAMLRTRDRAVTPEDFEVLTLQAGMGAVTRVRCLPPTSSKEAGTIRLLVVPAANTDVIARGEGIDPELLSLSPQLRDQIVAYLDERRLLGVQVRLQAPEYVGVAVQTEVALEPEYNNPLAQQEILWKLRIALYRFLNPITGGQDGRGWPFGRPVYPSDIVNLFQQFPAVRYLGVVQLFELRYTDGTWVRSLPQNPVIDPGPLGLICSWQNTRLRSGHVVNLIQ